MLRRVLPAAFMLLCCAAFAGTVTGHVFIDANADGKWQASEPAVDGAVVSDGLSFATAGADGCYELASPDGDQVIFIENPSGTWPTHGFYRNVKVGPATADFPLRQQEQKLPFYFVQGTDMHIRPEIAPLMARYVDAINSLPVPLAFVVHTGDLVADIMGQDIAESRKLFGAYQQMVAPLRASLFNLPGNHDHAAIARNDVPPDTPGFGKGLYRELFGPTYYAFNYAGIHFVALDGTDVVNNRVAYAISPACLAWLQGDLARVDKTAPLVLLTHEPLALSAQKQQVAALLAGHKVLLTLSGHIHMAARLSFAGAPEIVGGMTSYPWHGAGFPANPVGYHLIRMTREGFDDAFGDWAQKYPVTLLSPVRSAQLAGATTVDVQFLDPACEVTSAEIALGPARQALTEFGAQGLYRTLRCELATTGLAEGFHDLTITLHGKGADTVDKRAFLALGGPVTAFVAAGPATLRLKAHGIGADDVVKLNGEEIGKLSAAAGAEQSVSLTLPAGKLRRLNVIELVSAPLADGSGYDDFSADNCDVQYQGKTYGDYRLYTAGVHIPAMASGSAILYFDLTRPDL